MPAPASPSQPARTLGLFDAVCLIVGIIVGSGIYRTSPLVAQNVTGLAEQLWTLWSRLRGLDPPPPLPWEVLGPVALGGTWLFGAGLAFVGALCYAELTTAYPREGGDYVYLRRAFGRPLGFLFAWIEFWLIRPSSIGALAFVFGEYARELRGLGLGAWDPAVYGFTAVAVLTLTNLLGVQTGKWTQNVLTVVKAAGLLAVFVAAWFAPPAPPAAAPPAAGPGFSLAMILVLFTYGGWNDISYVAAEVRQPERNLRRALFLGVGGVAVIYLLVNTAFVRVLGFAGMTHSSAVAADAMGAVAGGWGARGISVLVCLSCLGAINGMLFTGSRIYYVVGREHRLFGWLAGWSPRVGAPWASLLLQGAVTCGLVLAFGGRPESFEKLVIFSAPLFWSFLLLVGIALIVLRLRDPARPRPFAAPFFPFTPLVFCLTCLGMAYSGVVYARQELSWQVAAAGCAVAALGGALCFWGWREEEQGSREDDSPS